MTTTAAYMRTLKSAKWTCSATLLIFLASVVSFFLVPHLSKLTAQSFNRTARLSNLNAQPSNHTAQSSMLIRPSAKCIFYDRPPRTGSTSIALTLAECVRRKNYTVPGRPNTRRDEAVTEMLQSSSLQLASVRNHMAISWSDFHNLRQRCGQLLYISSCAPMIKRIYSAAKYQFYVGHGNSTVDADMDLIVEQVKKFHWIEAYLEAYPLVTEEKKPLEDMPPRIVPDYVIRPNHLNEDLGELLNALDCKARIRKDNVHKAHVDDKAVLSRIELGMGDSIYHWMMKISEGNARGLHKAKLF